MPKFDSNTSRLNLNIKTTVSPKKKSKKHKANTSDPIEPTKDPKILEEDIITIEEDPKITSFELFIRAFVAAAITAVGIFTAFFPPTAPFAIFIIPVALTLSSAIVKHPTQYYIKQNPDGIIAKIFGVLGGAQSKVRTISKKIFKDEHALEGIALEAAASGSKHRGVKATASGLSATRVVHGQGSKKEQEAFSKNIVKHANTKVIPKKTKEKIVNTAVKQTTQQISQHRNKQNTIKPITLPLVEKKTSTPRGYYGMTSIKNALKKSGLKDVYHNKDRKIQKSNTPTKQSPSEISHGKRK